MFAEYFLAAEKHLRSIGKIPEIQIGNRVSEEQLNEVERIIERPIPGELRAYFHEMGDGYSFRPDEREEGFMIGWLGDYEYKVAGFPAALRDDLPDPKYYKHPPEAVAQELARREQWFPFYNFGGGGYMFCLDLNESPTPVRYYERCYWPTDPTEKWNLRMADSFFDFVRQWSRYCFASAKGATLINIALSERGRFDWSPSRFDAIYDRGTTQAEPSAAL